MWDELILLWTIKLLLKQEKDIYISAYNIAWLKNFLWQFVDTGEITFLKEIPKWFRSFWKFIRNKRWKDIKKYKSVDSVIIGWGEILTEEIPSTYWYWLISIFPCLRKKEKNIYLMWGIQIPKKWHNKKLLGYLLKKTKHIYARDLESVYELKKHWFENAEFFMDTSYFAFDWEQIKNQKRKELKYVVININKNGENFWEEILKDIKYYLNEWFKILYVPIAKWKNDYYSDINYYKKIKKEFASEWLDISRLEILDREENFKKFCEIIYNAKIVISTRLHLFLISNFLWTRTKVYPYQKKILKMEDVVRNLE